MHDLMFTALGDEYPFAEDVRVSWSDETYEFRLMRRGVVVTADKCFKPNSDSVLDAFWCSWSAATSEADNRQETFADSRVRLRLSLAGGPSAARLAAGAGLQVHDARMSDSEPRLLTETEAYRAAFFFVRRYYERGRSQAVFLMLYAMFSDPQSSSDWRAVMEAGAFRRDDLDFAHLDPPIDGEDFPELPKPIHP
jgi:hypothetical protein